MAAASGEAGEDADAEADSAAACREQPAGRPPHNLRRRLHTLVVKYSKKLGRSEAQAGKPKAEALHAAIAYLLDHRDLLESAAERTQGAGFPDGGPLASALLAALEVARGARVMPCNCRALAAHCGMVAVQHYLAFVDCPPAYQDQDSSVAALYRANGGGLLKVVTDARVLLATVAGSTRVELFWHVVMRRADFGAPHARLDALLSDLHMLRGRVLAAVAGRARDAPREQKALLAVLRDFRAQVLAAHVGQQRWQRFAGRRMRASRQGALAAARAQTAGTLLAALQGAG